MTSWCDATSYIYMKNGLQSQRGIISVPHKYSKYRAVTRPTPWSISLDFSWICWNFSISKFFLAYFATVFKTEKYNFVNCILLKHTPPLALTFFFFHWPSEPASATHSLVFLRWIEIFPKHGLGRLQGYGLFSYNTAFLDIEDASHYHHHQLLAGQHIGDNDEKSSQDYN